MLRKFMMLLLVMLLPITAVAEEFKEGTHFTRIAKPVMTADQNRIEVTEVFGYPCPHCNTLEPMVKAWEMKKADDVNFVRVPVVFGRSWEPLARAYYASSLMKTLDKTHEPTFHAMHVERKRLNGVEALSSFYSELGVDGKKFGKLYNSFAVNMKLKQGEAKRQAYGVQGVPAVVVNGKYLVTAQLAGGQHKMFEVVDYLVEQERAAK